MGGTWRTLGVVSGGARYPQYASLASRLATFDSWPTDKQQTPKDLSEAGFFHTGTDDQVNRDIDIHLSYQLSILYFVNNKQGNLYQTNMNVNGFQL